jgi:hypothetical protein
MLNYTLKQTMVSRSKLFVWLRRVMNKTSKVNLFKASSLLIQPATLALLLSGCLILTTSREWDGINST